MAPNLCWSSIYANKRSDLHAVIGSAAFEGMSMAQRQEEVWKWLRDNVSSESMVHLYAVHTWDPEEYKKYYLIVGPESI